MIDFNLRVSIEYKINWKFKLFKNIKNNKNKKMLSYLFIVNNIIPLIIIIIGLFGNTVSLIVLSRKNLKQIGPVLTYKLLFISDSLYLGIYI